MVKFVPIINKMIFMRSTRISPTQHLNSSRQLNCGDQTEESPHNTVIKPGPHKAQTCKSPHNRMTTQTQTCVSLCPLQRTVTPPSGVSRRWQTLLAETLSPWRATVNSDDVITRLGNGGIRRRRRRRIILCGEMSTTEEEGCSRFTVWDIL